MTSNWSNMHTRNTDIFCIHNKIKLNELKNYIEFLTFLPYWIQVSSFILSTFYKFRPFPASSSHLIFHQFSHNYSQFNITLSSSSVLLSCCHIHIIDDFLNYHTVLSLELELLTLPESTEGRSTLSMCVSVLDFRP